LILDAVLRNTRETTTNAYQLHKKRRKSGRRLWTLERTPVNVTLLSIIVLGNRFLDSEAYSRVVRVDGAGDARSGREFARIPPPPKTCPFIKYPCPKENLKEMLAEVMILQLIRLRVYAEWFFALPTSSTFAASKTG
jgi:hypothetical protein